MRLEREGSTGIPPWEAVAFDAWLRTHPSLGASPRALQETEYRDQHPEDQAAWAAAERQVIFPLCALSGFALRWLRCG
jgi:hypothetical protein